MHKTAQLSFSKLGCFCYPHIDLHHKTCYSSCPLSPWITTPCGNPKRILRATLQTLYGEFLFGSSAFHPNQSIRNRSIYKLKLIESACGTASQLKSTQPLHAPTFTLKLLGTGKIPTGEGFLHTSKYKKNASFLYKKIISFINIFIFLVKETTIFIYNVLLFTNIALTLV